MRIRLMALLATLAIIALGGFIAGCGDDDDDDGGNGGGNSLGLIEEGTLTVGSDIPYEPFEGGNPPDYEGFDIDLVNEIANKLGLEVRIVDTPFASIVPDTVNGKFDIVASATSITPEREEKVLFSDPYFSADQSLMVKTGSDIQSVDDLDGRTIGAQEATTGADYAEDETAAATVRTYPEIPDAFIALQNEQIEAVINDFAISKFAETEYPELQVIERIPTNESYGLMLPKENAALQAEVNRILQELIDDGTYAEIYRKWLEEDPPAEFQGG